MTLGRLPLTCLPAARANHAYPVLLLHCDLWSLSLLLPWCPATAMAPGWFLHSRFSWLLLLWQVFSNHIDISVQVYSPIPCSEDIGVKLQCTLPGNIAACWNAAESTKGHVHASQSPGPQWCPCLVRNGDPSPTSFYLNICFLGLPSIGLDSRPCMQGISARLLWSNFGLLYLMGPFHASMVR